MSDNTVTREECLSLLAKPEFFVCEKCMWSGSDFAEHGRRSCHYEAIRTHATERRLARAHIALLDKLDAEQERCAGIADFYATHDNVLQAGMARAIAEKIRSGEWIDREKYPGLDPSVIGLFDTYELRIANHERTINALRKRNAELEADCDIKAHHYKMQAFLAEELQKQLDRALSELAEEQKRMDWLESNATSVFMVGGEEVWSKDPDTPDWDLRHDIDAARGFELAKEGTE